MNLSKELDRLLSKQWLRTTLGSIGVVFAVLLIFDAGVAVGTRRGIELRGPHENTHEAPHMFGFGGFGFALPHGFIPGGHGAVGVIQTISLPSVTIATRDGNTQKILLESETEIKNGDAVLTPADLKTGDTIIVIGEPNEATTSEELDARLIRILPAQ